MQTLDRRVRPIALPVPSGLGNPAVEHYLQSLVHALQRALTGSLNAQDILARLADIDGAGSGLDADKLDGEEASAFADATHLHTSHSVVGHEHAGLYEVLGHEHAGLYEVLGHGHPESEVTFDKDAGHDHDGADSKLVLHASLDGVTSDQHHAQLHAATHLSGGADELIDGPNAVAYAAGNFTASGSMTWTVEAADQTTFEYVLQGKWMWVNFLLGGTTIGGTVSSALKIKIPASQTAANSVVTPVRVRNNGTNSIGYAAVVGDTFIYIYLVAGGNWTLSTNNAGAAGHIHFLVA